MICPKCNQPTGVLTGDGRCPYCRCDIQGLNRRVMVLYVLGAAFFMSILTYAGLVYLFELQNVHYGPLPSPWLPHLLLLFAVLLFGISWKTGRRLDAASSPKAVQSVYIVKLALVEAIVVMGLMLYFLSGSIKLFVTFLGLGVIGFMVAATQLPPLVRRMTQLCLAEQEQASASDGTEE